MSGEFFEVSSGVWYSDSTEKLKTPPRWNIHTARMKNAPALSRGEIERGILNPIGSKSLGELAAGKQGAVILCEDSTRPIKCEMPMGIILNELNRAGIPDSGITILIANGTHRPLSRVEQLYKFGKEIVKRVSILPHNCYDYVHYAGTTSYGTPVYINNELTRDRLIIGMGGVYPHGMAGFSGGAKIILPGAAGMETIRANHCPRKGGSCNLEDNEYRNDMEEAAALAGLSFLVNAVINEGRDICGIFAGDFIKAHRAAAAFALGVYDTPAPAVADVLLINAYPMDTELFQAAKSLELIRHYKHVRNIILIADCADGFGCHALCGHGGVLHAQEKKSVAELLRNRNLIIVSRNIEYHDVIKKFPDQTAVCGSMEEAVEKLQFPAGKDSINAILFPVAPLQIVNIS